MLTISPNPPGGERGLASVSVMLTGNSKLPITATNAAVKVENKNKQIIFLNLFAIPPSVFDKAEVTNRKTRIGAIAF